MMYVEQNLNIASELGKNEWVLEWRIKKSFYCRQRDYSKKHQTNFNMFQVIYFLKS